MKAAIIDRYGSPEVLQIKEVEQPQIEPDQMLVKVHASSINPIDWKIRKGLLKNRSGNEFPMFLGYDLSGEVIEVGDRINQFHLGDLIYARLDQSTGGGLRRICCGFCRGCCCQTEQYVSRRGSNCTSCSHDCATGFTK